MIDVNILKSLGLVELQKLRDKTDRIKNEEDWLIIQRAIEDLFLKNPPKQVKKKKPKRKINLEDDDNEYDDLSDVGLIEEFESKWK